MIYCTGQSGNLDCPLKNRCERFRDDDRLDTFATLPYDGHTCEVFEEDEWLKSNQEKLL